jgi:hypothetical protein
MIKTLILLLTTISVAICNDDLPSMTPQGPLRDYSNTTHTRIAQIERSLGISTTSWKCHLPKGYLVTLQWWQTGMDKPLWKNEIKTDDLPQPDGYFLALFEQSPGSTPAEDKNPRKGGIGFSTTTGEIYTHYFCSLDPRRTTYGDVTKIGVESELWSLSTSIEGPPRKFYWMTVCITKQ